MLEDRFDAAGIPVAQVELVENRRLQGRSQFGLIATFLMAMVVLLGIVGGLGLAGTMSLNVLERTREIGVMRAIGAPSAAINQMVIAEGLVIGSISWIFAAALGVPLGAMLSQGLGLALTGAPLDVHYSFAGPLIWLVLVCALAVVFCLLPAARARRISVRDALSYE